MIKTKNDLKQKTNLTNKDDFNKNISNKKMDFKKITRKLDLNMKKV